MERAGVARVAYPLVASDQIAKCPCERVDHRLLEPVRGRIGKVVSGGMEWYEVVGWGIVMMLLGMDVWDWVCYVVCISCSYVICIVGLWV